MDIRAELIAAAKAGIGEYLRTMRGAAACGAGATIDDNKHSDWKFTVRCADQNKTLVEFVVTTF